MGNAAAKEEQKQLKREFIHGNFVLNLQRLQITTIVFWCIGAIYLVFIHTGLLTPALSKHHIFDILGYVVLGLLLAGLVYMTYLRHAVGKIKRFTLHRLLLDAIILLTLLASIIFFFTYKETNIDVNYYMLVVLAMAAVPCLEPLEIGIIYLVAHGVFLITVFTNPAFDSSPASLVAVANSTVFVAFAFLVSQLTHNLRWSDFKKERRIREQNMELAHLANTDYLTNLYNKRYAYAALRMEWNRSIRSEKPLSLIMLDIDCFKDYNDAYGHIQGDQCLKEVAEVVRQSARRQTDQVCRFGGEELLVILPYTAGVDAYAIAEKIRKDVIDAAIPHENSVVAPVITVSAGVASMVGDKNTNFETLLERTDRALYRAKQNGRNMVVM